MFVTHCANCGQQRGFARRLGFGTFFMVLITFGLWLLVIPFYPKRCSVCGCERAPAENLRQGLSQRSPWEIIGLVVVVLVILIAVFSNKSGDKLAPTISSGRISDQLVAQMRADFHPSSMNWRRPLEMPEMKAIESRLFRERAAEIENYTTGEGHWAGNVAVINFCKPHDCGDHGGMLVVDTSSGQVAGSLRSPSDMDVFVGDYGSVENIPVVLKTEIEDVNTGVSPRYQKRIRYVDGSSTVTNNSGPSEDREVRVTPNYVGGNPLSDGRTYSVGLIVATSEIPVGTQLFAQGRVASFGYAGMRSRPFAIIEDEQQPGKTLLCAMMPDEGTEVLSLYHQGESVQVFGEYMGTLSLAGNPSMPTFSDCKVASPTDKVVRPAQVTEMPRRVLPTGDGSGSSSEEGTAIPADDRGVSSAASKTDALTGTYSGRVHNTTARLWAAFAVTMQEQEGNALAGCMFVHRPLYGSGTLSGKFQTLQVTFDVPSSVGVIRFTGTVDGDDIRGRYVVQRTGVVAESGEFELRRQSDLPTDFDSQNCPKDSAVQ